MMSSPLSFRAVQPSVTITRKWLAPLRKRVLILGSGKMATDLCRVLEAKRGRLVEVVGFLDKDKPGCAQYSTAHRIIGTYHQLFEIVERYRVHTVAVCIEDRRNSLPVGTLLDFKTMGIEVVDGHHLYEGEAGRLSIDELRPSTLVFSTGFRRRAPVRAIKRFVDILLSVTGLFVLAPLLIFVSLLIKLDSPGPILYRQMRVGLRGQPFLIWKFRTMFADAEKHGPRWATTEDPRVSRVGRWLRKLRIDELPQLVNVLKGEMSLVGPRPERPIFVQDLRTQIPYYDLRHTVRPGITGWAQIRFRYGASAEDAHVKLQYDLYYVKNLSLALDFRILIQTVKVVLLGEGAR